MRTWQLPKMVQMHGATRVRLFPTRSQSSSSGCGRRFPPWLRARKTRCQAPPQRMELSKVLRFSAGSSWAKACVTSLSSSCQGTWTVACRGRVATGVGSRHACLWSCGRMSASCCSCGDPDAPAGLVPVGGSPPDSVKACGTCARRCVRATCVFRVLVVPPWQEKRGGQGSATAAGLARAARSCLATGHAGAERR